MWLLQSSIGRKLVMSITGVFLILFLAFHGIMNFVVLFSTESYDAICAFLGANWYALVGTKILALGFVLHIAFAMYLTVQNKRARGTVGYAVTKKEEKVSWVSQNMLYLGAVIFFFMIVHLYQFWANMQFVEIYHTFGKEVNEMLLHNAAKGSHWVNFYFTDPFYSAIYLLWLVTLWLHLTHGFWSALQSMGMSNKLWIKRIKIISNIVATIIILLFMSIPVYFLLGFTI